MDTDGNEREALVPQGAPIRDLGSTRDYSEADIDTNANSRRHEESFIGLRMPRRPHRPGRSRSKRHTDKSSFVPNNTTASLTPSEQIQQLLGDHDDDEKSHDVFCQMDVLFKIGTELQWRESARWVKYEEDVEEGGERWSKPHVASLSLHSLFELRSTLLTGAVILDMDIHHISQLADLVVEHLVNSKQLEETLKDNVRTVLLAPHAHQHQKRRRSVMPGEELPRGLSLRRLSRLPTISDFTKATKGKDDASTTPKLGLKGNCSVPNMEHLHLNGGMTESPSSSKLNQQFMRKIPDGAEAANIMVGEVEGLMYQISAFIRLSDARYIGDLTEVPIPTRFVYIILGPPDSMPKLNEIARSISTIMVDEVFREVAFKARNRQDILSGIDEFLDQVTVLPPGEWDPKIRIEPPDSVPSQESRRVAKPPPTLPQNKVVHIEQEEESHCDPTLQRSGRLFGGLIADVRRKLPWYGSDFKDCLHMQCVASIVFLFLATLTPNVTFGGLLGIATDQYMGTMECILTASIVGVLFALFSGQPLNILGSTGPMLVLEMILYHFCHDMHLDFLPFRCWIGIWTAVILMLIVAFDLSALVRYITRFTEESFACLIALIFIYEAFKKQIGILEIAPINPDPSVGLNYDCWCVSENYTTDFNSTANYTIDTLVSIGNLSFDYPLPIGDMSYTLWDNATMNATNVSMLMTKEICLHNNFTLFGPGCNTPHYMSDVFFLSVLLFIGTFAVATGLVGFKTSGFFPTFVRQTLSDFAVLIAIILMVSMDVIIGIDTPKLQVPDKFQPSRPGRGWLVNPVSDKNPWWVVLAAIIPALLATILIFMDQQITAVIVNRKENKLKKGSGYHLDLTVVAICILICSFLGLPWYVAATVSAIAHIMSLKKESECTAPGERPIFLGVREQRVTALMVGLLSGLSVLMTSILKMIPMAVLYGVFLYMGVAALKGMQFIDRIMLIFMPAKYQPDTAYLRHVPIKRVHVFTLIQCLCLVVLWVVKQIKSVSIIFPIMVLGTCFVRKALDFLFNRSELKWLDDIMPEDKKRDKEDAKEGDEGDESESLLGEEMEKLMEMKIQHQMDSEKFGRAPVDMDRVNISEEMGKTGIWMQVRRDSMPLIENGTNNVIRSSTHKRKKDKNEKNSATDSVKPGFYVGDEEDNDQILEMPEPDERENKV